MVWWGKVLGDFVRVGGLCICGLCYDHAMLGDRVCTFVCVDGLCMLYVHMFVLTVYVNFVCARW